MFNIKVNVSYRKLKSNLKKNANKITNPPLNNESKLKFNEFRCNFFFYKKGKYFYGHTQNFCVAAALYYTSSYGRKAKCGDAKKNSGATKSFPYS